MKKAQKPILLKEDAAVLKKLSENGIKHAGSDTIHEKLKHAELVDEVDLGHDVARLNSLLLLRDKTSRRNFHYKLAVPDTNKPGINTDHVFRPLGAALLGMKKGEELRWKTANGDRYYFILNVVTPVESLF